MAQARWVGQIPASHSTYIAAIDAREVGLAAAKLGAGRQVKGAQIDPAVGFVFARKVGDHTAEGEPLFVIRANDRQRLEKARQEVLHAYRWSEVRVSPPPCVHGIVSPPCVGKDRGGQ